MGEIAVAVLKWLIRMSIVIAGIFSFVAVLNIATSMILVNLNQNVLTDIFAVIQIWLPFNLNVLLLWLIASSTAFILYRLSLASIIWINRLIGE